MMGRNRQSQWIVPFLLVWYWMASLDGVSAAFSLTIQPGEQECFYWFTPKDSVTMISGSFDCIHDDVEARDLSVSFSNADNGEMLYEAPTGSREGIFQLDKLQPSTRYALCFQNNESNDDEENDFDVGFSIHFMNAPRTLKDDEIGPDDERALKLVNKAARIHQDWANLMDHYEYVRNREAVHQHMNDAILVRLTRWTFFEAFLVIGMATGQVMYWKRFFETRRYL